MVIHQKKQKNVDEGDGDADRYGDCWIYIAKKADTKLHLAHSTGKRVQATADKLMKTVRKRGKLPTKDEKATFVSDGNDQYTRAILENFDVEAINYGQLVKEREKGRVVGNSPTHYQSSTFTASFLNMQPIHKLKEGLDFYESSSTYIRLFKSINDQCQCV